MKVGRDEWEAVIAELIARGVLHHDTWNRTKRLYAGTHDVTELVQYDYPAGTDR